MRPTPPVQRQPPAPEMDLAFRLESSDGTPLPADVADLLAKAGYYGDATAEGCWQALFSRWLAQLAGDGRKGASDVSRTMGKQTGLYGSSNDLDLLPSANSSG